MSTKPSRSRLAVYLLGTPYVELAGQLLEIPRRKLWALLACLCLNHEPFQRDTLAALIWPDANQSRARLALSRHLSELRQLLGDAWLRIERERISLHRSSDFWLDVDEFRRLSAHREGHRERGTFDLAALTAAAALYRDDFLTGFTLPDSLEFDNWQSLQSAELRRTLASVLESLVQDYIELGFIGQGTAGAALPFAHRWLELDRYHEPAHCQLMRLYALTGQRSAAMRQYRLCVQLLVDEFQTSPAAETTDLYRDIVQGRFPPVTSSGVPSVVSSVAHVALPIEIKGILAPRHNLSRPLTRFVGREDELSRLDGLLVNPDVRLVTILGPGGIGKSRLAMEAAARHTDRFVHGVWFVSLAALDAPMEAESLPPGAPHPLVMALVDVLPATFYGDGSLTDQLMAYLEYKEMLIIYDNFEHMLSTAAFVSDLLRRAPNCKVLVTSRARLNFQEEWLFALDGLPVPAVGALVHSENPGSAVALFHQHASRVRQDFDLVAEQDHVVRICRLVNGMPLGIELAAPWVRLMSGAQIAVEIERNVDFLSTMLHNIPERHRSLRALFDRSWRLLAPNEQAVLMRLSILHGFAPAEAEAVAGATLQELSVLVDHSFLQVTAEGRYTLHEHLRQFAVGQLKRIPSAYLQTLERHSSIYLSFVQTEGLRLYGNQVKQAIAAITADIENVRAAWLWAQEHERYDDLLRAVEGLGTFYEIKGWYAGAKEIFSQVVARLRPLVPVQDAAHGADTRHLLLAALLAQQSWFMTRMGLISAATEAIESSIALLVVLDDPPSRQTAFAQNFLGDIMILAGAPEAAIVPFERSYTLFAQLDDQYGMGLVLAGLCQALHLMGCYREAETAAQQSLDLSNQIGEQVNKGYALSTLARLAQARGQYALAEVLHQECLQLRQESGDQAGITFTLRHLGDTACLQGRFAQARRYYEECIRLSETMNLSESKRMAYYSLGNLALAQDDTDAAQDYFNAGLALCSDTHSPYASPGQVGLGRVALRQSDLVTAKHHLQSAIALTGRYQAFSGLQPVAAWVEYLAQAGLGQEAIVNALFLLQTPSATQEDRDAAARILDGLLATLSAEDLAAFQALGEQTTWEEIIASAMADFAG